MLVKGNADSQLPLTLLLKLELMSNIKAQERKTA